jgi:phosphatidylserine/phosphatidylglycerophosphate/cardiolipin synthase-like enzyme
MQSILDAGLSVFMDAEHSSVHNNIIIIDQGGKQPVLITGSFNFTFAAQNRNAENVLILHGNPDFTRAFYLNWRRHREHGIAAVRSLSR